MSRFDVISKGSGHGRRLAGRAMLALAVAGGLVTAGIPGAAMPQAQAASYPVINKNDQSSVISAYQNWYLPTKDVPAGWTGSAASCSSGVITAAAKQAELDALNYFRAMMSLDPVTEDTALSAKSQAAALVFASRGELSHQIDSSWPCHTADAQEAAANSNIALGTYGARAMELYMSDAGADGQDNPTYVGHRRWLAYPYLGVVGMGDTSNSNDLYTMHSKRNTSASDPGWVPWPTAGYFPAEFWTASTSWSLSRTGADFSAAQVTMTKNGASVPVTKQTYRNQATVPTLVWRYPGFTRPAAGATDTYHVKVTGVSGATSSYEYDVKVINASPTKAVANVAAPRITGEFSVGSTLTCGGDQWSPTPASRTYEWTASDPSRSSDYMYYLETVARTDTPTYKLSASDIGRTRWSCEVTAKATGYLPGVATSPTDKSVAGQPLTMTASPAVSPLNQAVGADITATPGSYSPSVTDISYEWCAGSTCTSEGPTYRVPASAAGKVITVKVTAARSGYASKTTTLNAGTARTGSLAAKRISETSFWGTAQVGQSLTAIAPSYRISATTFSYQWLRGGTAISGATGTAYKLVAADKGARISLRVTARAAGYADDVTASTQSEPVAAAPAASSGTTAGTPAGGTSSGTKTGTGTTAGTGTKVGASTATGTKTGTGTGTAPACIARVSGYVAYGTPRVGMTMKVAPGQRSPGNAQVAWQWTRNGAKIAGATGASYTLTGADAGKGIGVIGTAKASGCTTTTNDLGTIYDKVAKGSFTIKSVKLSGTVKVKKKLKVKATASLPGVTYTYQWLRAGKPIKGATKAAYTLSKKDKNKKISVKVKAVKTGYNQAVKTSKAVKPKK